MSSLCFPFFDSPCRLSHWPDARFLLSLLPKPLISLRVGGPEPALKAAVSCCCPRRRRCPGAVTKGPPPRGVPTPVHLCACPRGSGGPRGSGQKQNQPWSCTSEAGIQPHPSIAGGLLSDFTFPGLSFLV